MPTGNTPIRPVRMSEELWRAAQEQAAEDGLTVSEVIRRFLADYVEKGRRPLRRRATRRKLS